VSDFDYLEYELPGGLWWAGPDSRCSHSLIDWDSPTRVRDVHELPVGALCPSCGRVVPGAVMDGALRWEWN
jgi:hypothetical protein